MNDKDIVKYKLSASLVLVALLSGCNGDKDMAQTSREETDASVSKQTVATDISATTMAGFWRPDEHIYELKTLEGETPPLLPDALALYQERRDSKTDGIPDWDNEHNCLPLGITRLMSNYPFELVVADDNLVVIYEWNNHVQLIPVAEEFGELAYPFYLGNSIASYDQGVWTINSEYFDDTTILDEKGMPHSESLFITQELQLEGKDQLVNTMTIEDPNVFSRPWQTKVTYSRMPAGSQLAEDVCVKRLGLESLDTSN